jgi:AcrR family transcriptional regulator
MRKRDRAAAETRAAIIEAAHGLLNQPDGTSLTLQEVAAAAGVTRATVYNSIGSRRELLAAVFEDQGRLIRYDRVLEAMRLDDPANAIVETVRASCRAWAVMPEAIRKTQALAAIDAESRELVDQYERYRRAELASLARRAVAAGSVDTQLRTDDVTAALALLTGFQAFDQLRLDHSARAATERLVRMTRAWLGITS